MTATLEIPQGLQEVDQLLEEGTGLASRLGDLGISLRTIAAQLEAGVPPSPGLAANVIEVSKAFENWHDKAKRSLNTDVEGALPNVLEALKGHRHVLEQAQLKKRAMGILEQISSLAYRGSEEFMPLSTIQFDAVGMMRAIKDAPKLDSTAQALASGTHPFNLLLQLLTNKELSNDDWTRVYQTVGQEVGMDLAVAVVRDRIYLPD